MNYWSVLGIDPTESKEEIRTAYINKLSHNPEMEEEEFEILKEAFDELIKNCSNDDSDEDKSLVLIGNEKLNTETYYHDSDYDEDSDESEEENEEQIDTDENYLTEKDFEDEIEKDFEDKNEENDIDKNLKYYLKLAQEEPENKKVNFYLAELYDEMGDYDSAIKYYTKQIQIDPNPDYLANRAWILKKSGKTEYAVKDYEDIIKMKPDRYEYYIELAMLCFEMDNYERAVYLIKESMEFIDEQYMEMTYTILVKSYYRIQEYKEALKYAEDAIEKWPEVNDFYVIAANCYVILGSFSKGIKLYTDKIEKETNLINKAWFCKKAASLYIRKQNNYKEALEWYYKAALYIPNDREIFNHIADTFRRMEKYSLALRYTEKQLSISDDFKIYAQIANIYYQMGSVEKSKEQYQKALEKVTEKDLKDGFNAAVIAECYIGIGNLDKAEEFTKKIGAVRCIGCENSRCFKKYLRTAQIFEAKGKYKNALNNYKMAVKVSGRDYDCMEGLIRAANKFIDENN